MLAPQKVCADTQLNRLWQTQL